MKHWSKNQQSAPVGSKYHEPGGAPASALPAVHDSKPPRRPFRQQEVKLKTKLNCADLTKDLIEKLGMTSCFHCDSFPADRFFCLLVQNKKT